ncbi:uncharacterized protein VTP21DRAFT_1978 [Calcarisporiella thermophila]|uniref:uncharacterized protein n=1 Tax=Calcarisporiella thermophila TaxID=911321 RepID=UPI00374385EB
METLKTTLVQPVLRHLTRKNLDWSTLRSSLSSNAKLVTGDEAASAIQNYSDYAHRTPQAVVWPASTDDVVETVKFVEQNQVPFSVYSGGTCWFPSNTVDDGLVINMSLMRDIHVDPENRTVAVEGGVVSEEIAREAEKHGLAVVTSSAGKNGMGFYLGGGLSRRLGQFGLGSNSILEAEVVTADGQVLTATPDNEHADLLWALRGAGHNFGVVTKLKLRAHLPRAEQVYYGDVVFPAEKLDQILTVLKEMERPAPFSCQLFMMRAPPEDKLMIIVRPYYEGSETEAKVLFRPLLELGPVVNEAHMMSYTDHIALCDKFCHFGERKLGTGDLYPHIDSENIHRALEKLVAFGDTFPEAKNTSFIFMELFPAPDTIPKATDHAGACFPSEDLSNLIAMFAWWKSSTHDEAIVARLLEIRRTLLEGHEEEATLTCNCTSGFEDPRDVYGKSWGRLRELKRKYDPNNLFCHHFPIDPALATSKVEGRREE